ncbi:MAG: WD40 repeat domain-containing protein [Fimbriimonadaceae bacterium]
MCVDFSPDGKQLAGAFADGLLRVWNVADGKETWVSDPSALRAIHLRWHPSGNRLVLTNASGWIASIEPGSGKLNGPNKDHAGTSRFVTFGLGGNTILVSHARGGNTPSLVVLDANTLATTANFESLCTDGWVTPDGRSVVALGGDGEMRVFDMGNKQRTYKANPISQYRFFMPARMTMSPDGRTVLLAGDLGSQHGFFVLEVASLK